MNELDVRQQSELIKSFELAQNFINKRYLTDLTDYKVMPIPSHIESLTNRDNIRLFRINKLVYDKNENNIDKLSNVYNALGSIGASLIIIINSDGKNNDMYLGTRQNISGITSAKNVIEKSFKGNFPGSEIENLKNSKIEELIENITTSKIRGSDKAISCVSGIPSLKDDDKDKFVQGIEKLIDAMKGEKFSAVFIADPVETTDIENIKAGYECLYSNLLPFGNTELSFNQTDSEAVTEGLTKGVTSTVSESLTMTQSHTSGWSESNSHTENKSTSRSASAAIGAAGAGIGFMIGGPLGAGIGVTVGGVIGGAIGSVTKGSSDTYSSSKNKSDTEGMSSQKGSSTSDSIQESQSITSTLGNSKSLQIKFENKSVLELLDKIDGQLSRINDAENFGMWNCASYFIADDVQTSRVASSTFKSLIRGESSFIENSFINTWDNDNKRNLVEATKYIEKLSHPLIDLNVDIGMNLPNVTPCSLVSGKELPIQFGLPQKSISGITVMEMAEFGRNIISYDKNDDSEKIKLGNIFHLSNIEDTEVELDLNSLSMHTFITGSTGSGKSNTVYEMLDQLESLGINYLIIEPTKGEYKNVFGKKKNVKVLGTNPKYTELLKINPFKFPSEIHVLEHVDRLIEIFNVCWPMYAAMPAVLKEAVIKSYEVSGWNLNTSENRYSYDLFPTFEDLLVELQNVINSSAYSEELKSNYSGALLTRVKSLTNGLNGSIFSPNEVDNEILFDSNVIVDLSRIGSLETKSLIMGILIMRLSEHRMCFTEDMNTPLKHVTVLEEAHNILKKTSTEQSQDGANLMGKSVEMLSNAIAEMRTYGEGFIIADQSPNAVDLSAIRNTNTKIIMRLPDEADRRLAGKSAGLKDEQLDEIAKLPRGVAAIYQNDWLEPILCKINKFEGKEEKYKYESGDNSKSTDINKEFNAIVLRFLLKQRVDENLEVDIDTLVDMLSEVDISTKNKINISLLINEYKQSKDLKIWKEENFESLAEVVSSIIGGKALVNEAIKVSNDYEEFNIGIKYHLENIASELSEDVKISIIQCLLKNNYVENNENNENLEIYTAWVNEMKRGAII